MKARPQLFLCIGHRGAMGHEPENTLRSFRRAIELGADAVELDVQFVDDRLVVFHDRFLGRTTNGFGFLVRKRFDELRELDAGKGERIPTLAEVLDLVARRVWVNIELKGPGTAKPTVALLEQYVVHHGWRWDDFLISSFDHDQLRAVQRLQPALRLGVLFNKSAHDAVDRAAALGAYSLHLPRLGVKAESVHAAHAASLKVFAYTVNALHDLARMHRLGVDGVFTNYPDRIRHGSR